MAQDQEPAGITAPGVMEHLAELTTATADEVIDRALGIARQHLDMDVSYVSRFTDGHQVFEALDGDAQSFDFSLGDALPLSQTYCYRMVAGDIPNVIADTSRAEVVKDLAVTTQAGIGAYLGVPLTLSDGRLYGSLCCVSHDASDRLDDGDVKVMQVIARLISFGLEEAEAAEKSFRLRTQAATVTALAAAIEARDGYTAAHSGTVVDYAIATAIELGLDQSHVAQVGQVALLHDVGKVGIPDAILRKEGPLNDEEWRIMKEHTIIGHSIVSSVEGLAHLASAVRAEHERWDGTGYPDGLSGSEIPIASRIVLVCDAFHAMVSDRPYRRAMSVDSALSELAANSGSQFSPEVVEAFIASHASGKPAARRSVARGNHSYQPSREPTSRAGNA